MTKRRRDERELHEALSKVIEDHLVANKVMAISGSPTVVARMAARAVLESDRFDVTLQPSQAPGS